MKLNKTSIATAMGLALAGASLSAQANLTTTTVLAFGVANGYGASYFTMQPGGPTSKTTTSINSFQGIKIGVLQPASGSHSGKPNATESPSVDNPWAFFGSTGMDQVVGSAVTENGTHTGTTALLNFRGWNVTWNFIASIPMGGDTTNFASDTGIATLVCSTTSCSNTSSFTLDHAAHVPLLDPSNFGGVPYTLHLAGHVSAAETVVPVPAAVWLLGSGLAGVAAMARRRNRKG